MSKESFGLGYHRLSRTTKWRRCNSQKQSTIWLSDSSSDDNSSPQGLAKSPSSIVIPQIDPEELHSNLLSEVHPLLPHSSPTSSSCESEVPDYVSDDTNSEYYQRGMTDVIRFLSGKSSLTSSENEERGRGKRKAVKNRRFENMVSNVEEAEDEEEEEEEVSVSFMQEPPLRRVRSSPSSSSPISQKSSSSSHSPPVLEPLLKKKRCEKVFEKSKGCCRVGKNKKHSCPFDGSEVGFEQLAHTLCALSREIKKMNTNLFYLRETQNELVKSVEVLRTAQESRADVDMPSLHYPPEGIIEDFPASTMESLQKIERKLMERSFLIRCVTYVASCADKTSEGRTITSIMRKLVTLDVAVNFSWKGVQRKDHKIGLEKKPFKNLLIAKVMFAATKRCWPKSESKQVQLKAATWLAQAQSKLDKMNQPSTPATYNNNNQHRL